MVNWNKLFKDNELKLWKNYLRHYGKTQVFRLDGFNRNRFWNSRSRVSEDVFFVLYAVMWFLFARDNMTVAFHEALTASMQRKCSMVIMVASPASSFCTLTSCRRGSRNWSEESKACSSAAESLCVCMFLLTRSKDKRELLLLGLYQSDQATAPRCSRVWGCFSISAVM